MSTLVRARVVENILLALPKLMWFCVLETDFACEVDGSERWKTMDTLPGSVIAPMRAMAVCGRR